MLFNNRAIEEGIDYFLMCRLKITDRGNCYKAFCAYIIILLLFTLNGILFSFSYNSDKKQ
jgi:hypothetical protein